MPFSARAWYVRTRMAMRLPELSAPPNEAEPRRKPHIYLRTPDPVYFPATETVPETNENMERRWTLYQSLKRAIAGSATIGSDQFVYWDPTTAKKRLAPDVFVRLGSPHAPFRVWKVWERGAPEVGVEIVSDADEGEPDWNEKLARYRSAGIAEVVRFDAEDPKTPIRIWDLISGDLVERSQDDPHLRFCEALRAWWVVVEHPSLGPTLRVARDPEGRDLLPTPEEETAKANAEAAKLRAATAKANAENERLRAEMEALRAQLASERPKPRKRKS